ncbi:RNA polymerase sigma factor SigJ [Cytobacillus sp. IB215665]|uniref:RNA polymerase sigma factor SigJ n=1 Tax=Cytobacillus sp. IB215665 TaxID=3097357 RepID=UPI002A162ED6|nr:RNA polymerase sigma factor SigJ [Cytobacillus sp. IB215665]MDX8366302.1 RNA polymerase sigma factor SigJ [Cytobacillus sp. IB215665]
MENSLIQQLYIDYKPLLFSLAYKMTGSVSDADDVVQDVFSKLTNYELKNNQNVKAFLCKLVTNRSLDLLKSSRKKREIYTGTWLPEPIVQYEDPLNHVMAEEDISIALLFLFESLNPIERAIFILREILEYDYKTVADIVQKSESNCRKILSRLKKELPDLNKELLPIPAEEHEQTVVTFISAFQTGKVTNLVKYLQNDITYYADGGGKKAAALRPVIGKEKVSALFKALAIRLLEENYKFQLNTVNGQAGLTILDPTGFTAVVSFKVYEGKIKAIYYIVNPDKVRHIQNDVSI